MRKGKMAATRFFIIVIILMTFFVLSGPTIFARQGPPQVPPGKDIVDENKEDKHEDKNRGWDNVVEKFIENGITLPGHVNNGLFDYIREALEPEEVIYPLVAAGFEHSLAVTTEGLIYAWGDNRYGQLGNGTTQSSTTPINITENISLNEGERIIQIVASYNHSMALTNEGHLFVWGSNSSRQLGIGSLLNSTLPIDISGSIVLDESDQIILITGEHYHSMALTQSGRVFAWGRHLATGGYFWDHYPVEITNTFQLNEEDRITNLYASWYHSMALTEEGKVFSWGLDYYGQAGLEGRSYYQPTDITHKFNLELDDKIIELAIGHRHSGALTEKGHVFTWGQNWFGQLGDGTKGYYSIYTPLDITNNFQLENRYIIHFAAATYHSFVMTNEKDIYMWGYNAYGQMGTGDFIDVMMPLKMNDVIVMDDDETFVAYSGYMHTIIVTSKNRYYTFGYNTRGQLGNGLNLNSNTPVEITEYLIN